MKTILAFIKKFQVLSYFVLAFAISWGGVVIFGSPLAMPATVEQFEKLWTAVVFPYFLGPALACVLLTGLVRGRAGFRELRSGLFKWRAGLGWYAAAILAAPLLSATLLLIFSLVSPVFLPGIVIAADKVTLLLSGAVTGIFFGGVREELADIVILTLPFSVLRDVKMDLDMPPFKRKAINELGYGTNIKIVTSTPKRLWREQGFTGEVFADNPLQLVWDNSENQSFASGGLTFFHGGSSATELMRRAPDKILQTFWPALDKTFPGLRQQGHGKLYMFTWPTYRFSKGSYACYKPGQWTTLAGAEKVPVDRLFFAGEHCSYAHQGMMNGAVESGMQVAETILSRFIGAATG